MSGAAIMFSDCLKVGPEVAKPTDKPWPTDPNQTWTATYGANVRQRSEKYPIIMEIKVLEVGMQATAFQIIDVRIDKQ